MTSSSNPAADLRALWQQAVPSSVDVAGRNGVYSAVVGLVTNKQGAQLLPHLGWILDYSQYRAEGPQLLASLMLCPELAGAEALAQRFAAILDQRDIGGYSANPLPYLAHGAEVTAIANSARLVPALYPMMDERVPKALQLAAAAGRGEHYATLAHAWYGTSSGHLTGSFNAIAPSLAELLKKPTCAAEGKDWQQYPGITNAPFIRFLGLAKSTEGLEGPLAKLVAPYSGLVMGQVVKGKGTVKPVTLVLVTAVRKNRAVALWATTPEYPSHDTRHSWWTSAFDDATLTAFKPASEAFSAEAVASNVHLMFERMSHNPAMTTPDRAVAARAASLTARDVLEVNSNNSLTALRRD